MPPYKQFWLTVSRGTQLQLMRALTPTPSTPRTPPVEEALPLSKYISSQFHYASIFWRVQQLELSWFLQVRDELFKFLLTCWSPILSGWYRLICGLIKDWRTFSQHMGHGAYEGIWCLERVRVVTGRCEGVLICVVNENRDLWIPTGKKFSAV
jgi:hypothetical protein